jgi:asparagine synthase (glutamine-hydrolysing)
MGGICGIALSDRDAPGTGEALPRMLDALALQDAGQKPGQAATVEMGPVALGAVRSEGRVAGVAETKGWGSRLALAFHGSLYGVAESGNRRNDDVASELLTLYLEKGLAFLARLRGDFALVLWDEAAGALHVATDRFRIHPIFYSCDRQRLVIASRLGAILALPGPTALTVEPAAVVDVIGSSAIATPRTVFEQVKKLEPGTVLTYRDGHVERARYWDVSFVRVDGRDERALAEDLRQRFREAIAVRLKSEEGSDRIGTFLSGGVDSSAVTGVLTELTKAPVKSFSIGFADERFNEIGYARLAARRFGSEHHEHVLTPEDACRTVPVIVNAFDEPFGNASAIATYFCAQLARAAGVKTLYAGDGGDELFAGNERYATQRLFDYYGRVPSWARRWVVEPLVRGGAERLGWPVLVKGKKYIARATIPYPARLSSYGFLSVVPMVELFTDGFLDRVGRGSDPYQLVCDYYAAAPARTALDRQLYVDLKLALSDNDLFKVVRMTEINGLSVRFPFLDDRVVDLAARVPASLKMRGRRLRTFFKRAYRDVLPRETITKTKHGFGVPIATWLKSHRPLRELVHDTLLGSVCLHRGYLRRKGLEEILRRHQDDRSSFYGTAVWNLLILELWLQAHTSTAG